MSNLIYAHNNERTDLGEFTPEKVADLIISYPPPGSYFLLAGERVRVVGECLSDPTQVPVQTCSGHLLLVPVVKLEREVKK